ncbi:MAG: hypothetical protein ACRCTE_09710 [Cellulosilyticaceae bacterium]
MGMKKKSAMLWLIGAIMMSMVWLSYGAWTKVIMVLVQGIASYRVELNITPLSQMEEEDLGEDNIEEDVVNGDDGEGEAS